MPTSSTPSWLALVASAALGVAAFAVTAEVRAEGLRARGPLRLVVQAFDGGDSRSAHPVSSLQRAVTAEELERGVTVDVLELTTSAQNPRFVAWVEPGEADLEHGGRVAKPGRRSVRGHARGERGKPVSIVLRS